MQLPLVEQLHKLSCCFCLCSAPCRHAELQLHHGGGTQLCHALTTASLNILGVTHLCPGVLLHLLHKLQLPSDGSGL